LSLVMTVLLLNICYFNFINFRLIS
jgi:hypothetical protein